jgi:homoaconitase/3-isopropylmalate dehydratase large subunit
VTERFLKAGEAFARSLPPESKPRFVAAMQAELGSNRATVSIDQFASDHVSTGDRSGFKEQMRERKVPKRFHKDTDLVAQYLQRVQMNVDDGSIVITPTENLDRSVRINDLDGGNSRIEITGRITETRSRGAR